jgi:hypothetical protein
MAGFFRLIEDALASLFRRGKEPEEFRKEDSILAFRILQHAGAQGELGLSSQQINQLQQIIRETRQSHQKEMQALRTQESETQQRDMLNLRAEVAADVLKGLDRAGVLTPQQKVRLQQILWQNRGPVVFSDPALQTALGLTPEQRTTIRTVAGETWRKMQGAPQLDEGGGGDERFARRATLRQEAMSKALAALSDEQRQRWHELIGQPFEIKFGPAHPQETP